MLDDGVWQALAELPAPEALAVVQDGADALDKAPGGSLGNVNTLLMVSEYRACLCVTSCRASGGCLSLLDGELVTLNVNCLPCWLVVTHARRVPCAG
jgi:hypothetical protein